MSTHSDKAFCPRCKKGIETRDNFCRHCGRSLKDGCLFGGSWSIFEGPDEFEHIMRQKRGNPRKHTDDRRG